MNCSRPVVGVCTLCEPVEDGDVDVPGVAIAACGCGLVTVPPVCGLAEVGVNCSRPDVAAGTVPTVVGVVGPATPWKEGEKVGV